jgi:hypothetical protein
MPLPLHVLYLCRQLCCARSMCNERLLLPRKVDHHLVSMQRPVLPLAKQRQPLLLLPLLLLLLLFVLLVARLLLQLLVIRQIL